MRSSSARHTAPSLIERQADAMNAGMCTVLIASSCKPNFILAMRRPPLTVFARTLSNVTQVATPGRKFICCLPCRASRAVSWFHRLLIPQQPRNFQDVIDMEFVDFHVDRGISFFATDRFGMFLPILEAVDVAADLQLAIGRGAEPVFVTADLDGEFF